MHFRLLLASISIIGLTGCSNVREALYDANKRKEYARDARENFSHSEAGRELTLKKSIVEDARAYIGTRYKYASIDPKQGFDCSGLVYHVAKKQNITLPRSSRSLAAAGPHIPWKKAKPGDLVFFGDKGRIHHVGIIEKIKGDELWIIHSTTQRGVIHENVMLSPYWKKRTLFAIDFSTLANPEKIKS